MKTMKKTLAFVVSTTLLLAVLSTALSTIFAAASDSATSSSAVETLRKAANDNADDVTALDWNDYDWKVEYRNTNKGWTAMELRDATNAKFASAASADTLPCVRLNKYKGAGVDYVELAANQYPSASWYDMAALTYTAKKAGNYVINCDNISVGARWSSNAWKDTNSAAGSDGHVIVYKNDEKIWPTDAAYGSVKPGQPLSISALNVTLAEGDVIRFVAYGGVEGVDSANCSAHGNGWLTHILMNPVVTSVAQPTQPEVEEARSYASVETLRKAADDNADDVTALNWGDYAWKVEYRNTNKGWTAMELRDATNAKFASAASADTLPCVRLNKYKGAGVDYVELAANQYPSASWYDMAALTFTAPKAGKYVINCDNISVGARWSSNAWKDTNSAEGSDGHVIVYKNEEKIWPTDAAYGSVKPGQPLSISALNVTLAEGDVIRFVAYGGVEGVDSANCSSHGNGWLTHILMNPVIATAQPAKPLPETEAPSYAVDSVKSAATAAADDEFSLDWDAVDWRLEYISYDRNNWEPMVLANAASFSFSQSGTHGAQPAGQAIQNEGKGAYYVQLLANQNAPTRWSKAAITYVAKTAGEYVLTCDYIGAGSVWSSSANGFVSALNGENGDGHLTVYKNDTQIWPAQGYASITDESAPTFDPMLVELKKGDVIRFEGFGGTVGGAVSDANPNGWMNHIRLNPAIARAKTGSTTDTTSSTTGTTSSTTGTTSSTTGTTSSTNGTTSSTTGSTTTTTRIPSTDVDSELNNLKVLFVGNSFTEVNNMPNMFKKLAEKAGITVTVDMITWGGCTLARYADPNDDAGKDFRRKLEAEPDIVFMQDLSATIATEESRKEHIESVKTLDEMVRAKGGKSIMLARAGVNYNNVGFTPTEQNAEFLKLAKAASEAIGGAPIADVASAYEYVRQNFADINLYSSDEAHPGKAGSFLTACVCFATLYDLSPVDLYNAGLNDALANTLQQVAAHVVFGSAVVPPDPDSGSDPETPSDDLLAPGKYSANESLKNSLAAGDVLTSELWQPVYSTVNTPKWSAMLTGEETFSQKGTDWAIPYVAPLADGSIVLNANQWANGGWWWDKAGVTFTAPADQDVILTSGNIKTISAGSAEHLTTTEARVAIYLNGTKIWPTDKDYVAITQSTSVDFPTIELSLKKGDVIAIECFGAVPGGKITDNTNGAWNNQVKMDPVIVVPGDDTDEPGSTDSTSSTTGSTSSTTGSTSSSTSQKPTTPSKPNAGKDSIISANTVLSGDLAKGDVQADSVWKPVYTDANSIVENVQQWKEMIANDDTFSMKSLDYALPFVYPTPNGGLVMNANQWADGGLYWDKAGVIYTAPENQSVVLKAGDIKTISAATEYEAGACTVSEGRVAIYKNGVKIWPVDADFVSIRAGESVKFPEIALDLKKGDVILIEAYGAKRGGVITDAHGGGWQNHVLMDPVIAMPVDDDNTNDDNGGNEESPDTGVTVIPVVAAMLLASSATGLVVINRKRR